MVPISSDTTTEKLTGSKSRFFKIYEEDIILHGHLEALVLQLFRDLSATNGHKINNRIWIRISYRDLMEQLHLSLTQVRRLIGNLRADEALLVSCFSLYPQDTTPWYSVGSL